MSDRIVPKDFYVYLHRRATDGLVFYVGKGSGRRAWSKNRSKFWKNIAEKHGYIVEFVEKGLQEWAAFELEVSLICFYGRENLCNLTDGGDGSLGCQHTEATKSKMSASHMGVPKGPMSDAAKIKLGNSVSNALRGKKRSKFTQSHIAALQAATIKISGKPVLCEETGVVYSCVADAVRWVNQTNPKAAKTLVCKSCKGKVKTAYGYTWSYV
jgi:hypothetical protein